MRRHTEQRRGKILVYLLRAEAAHVQRAAALAGQRPGPWAREVIVGEAERRIAGAAGLHLAKSLTQRLDRAARRLGVPSDVFIQLALEDAARSAVDGKGDPRGAPANP